MIIKIEAALRRKSTDLDITDESALIDLVNRLIKEVNACGIPAYGLAAPQIGTFKNMFIKWNFKTHDWDAYVNPKILNRSKEIINFEEMCLSLPGKRTITDRHKSIEIIDHIHGTQTLDNIDAIIVAHEFDHTIGKLMLDRATRIKNYKDLNLYHLVEGENNSSEEGII